jgi:hypothetical protein
MAQISNNNVSGSPTNADAEVLVARARLMMIISAVTTLIAIAAVVSVIGYRLLNGAGGALGADGIITLPKGARLISTVASGGHVAVLIDIGGASELRTFDIKTLRQTGRPGPPCACMAVPSRLFRGQAPFV